MYCTRVFAAEKALCKNPERNNYLRALSTTGASCTSIKRNWVALQGPIASLERVERATKRYWDALHELSAQLGRFARANSVSAAQLSSTAILVIGMCDSETPCIAVYACVQVNSYYCTTIQLTHELHHLQAAGPQASWVTQSTSAEFRSLPGLISVVFH
ncbi:hypothetical protein BaRGS_00010582 [Batillaria attramentaria]|uniref:Uncharacterized protein n=1 Tax=Batillaria attramentaria TaxID=370345 RepID=A0ABD0LG74_9CAEN